MKYLPLIWSGMWRKRGRAILILLQVAIAFALFGLLQGMRSGLDAAVKEMDADVYNVVRATGDGPLPLAHFSRIQSLDGVVNVQRQSFLSGTYQNPNQNVLAIATDVQILMKDKVDLSVAPTTAAAAMEQTRDGALVGRKLAEKYGWKVGDRVPLQTREPQQNGSRDWTFQVLGVISDPETWGMETVLVVNWEYFNQARVAQRDTVARYIVRMGDPKQGLAMAQKVDALFANSSDETRTESLGATVQNSLQAVGDLNFIVRAIVGAAMFALLFSIATMMMQSTRERTPELAVLRTLGFSDRRVFWILVLEAMALCIIGAALGLVIAARLIPLAEQFIGALSMPWFVAAIGLAIALLLAVISAALPAWRSLRLQVAEALSGR